MSLYKCFSIPQELVIFVGAIAVLLTLTWILPSGTKLGEYEVPNIKGINKRAVIIGNLLFVFLTILLIYPYCPNEDKKDCLKVTLKGKIIGRDNSKSLKIRQVSVESSPFDIDNTVDNGVFYIEGFQIPKSKIITLIIETTNENYINRIIDLNNNDKYPTKDNCNIDLGVIVIENIKENSGIKKTKGITPKKLSSFSLSPDNLIDFRDLLVKELKIKYSLIEPTYQIEFSYTGSIVPVEEGQSLFCYHGGYLNVLINELNCVTLKEIPLSRTHPVGNSKDFVESEVNKEIKKEVIKNKYLIIQKIKSCL